MVDITFSSQRKSVEPNRDRSLNRGECQQRTRKIENESSSPVKCSIPIRFG